MPSALEPYPVFGTVQCAQAPVWEHTASLAESFQPKVKFAKVDCTDANNEQLCADNHIQAYPTIILFSSVNGEHAHEFYHGMGLASLAARSECCVRRLRQRLDLCIGSSALHAVYALIDCCRRPHPRGVPAGRRQDA